MVERKYNYSFAELLDRLTIVQQKECKIPSNRSTYSKEIEDILHDLQIFLDKEPLNSKDVRDIVVLALINSWIWQNESNVRNGITDGNNLILTHGLNSIRCEAKNRIESRHNGRTDVKSEYITAPKEWVPSDYGKD